MRVIRFRGKEMGSGKWVTGFYTQGGCLNPDTGETTVRHLIQNDTLHDIDPATLGQFSGLHDKNGRDIYEGDLVDMMRTPEGRKKCVMTRHIATAKTVLSWTFDSLTKQVLSLGMLGLRNFDSYRFEVVGNVHDNPELAQKISLELPEHKPRKRNSRVKIEFVKKGVKVSTTVSQETAQNLIEKINQYAKEL